MQKNCTIYTIQFLSEDDSEFEKFYIKFRNELKYNENFELLLNILGRIADFGALERFFSPEGKMNDRVCAMSVLKSKLRLYCLRLSDKILILGNGEVKKTGTYGEGDSLKGVCYFKPNLCVDDATRFDKASVCSSSWQKKRVK